MRMRCARQWIVDRLWGAIRRIMNVLDPHTRLHLIPRGYHDVDEFYRDEA